MANMNDQPKGNGRCFIDIHLRQWTKDEHIVRLRDANGSVVELDGLIHDRPHQFILVELSQDAAAGSTIIDVPGVFADYHPHNGRELGSQAPAIELADGTIVPAGKVKSIPHPAPKVHVKDGELVWSHNGEPVHPRPMDAKGKPAERGQDAPGPHAAAPLGVHREIKPPQ